MSNINEFYKETGELLSKINGLDFLVNGLIEKIISEYSSELDGNKITEEIIDHINQESLKKRISFIIIFTSMTLNITDKLKNDFLKLKQFATYYNKNIKDIRDFIAHNPIIITDKSPKLISSRRFVKNKLNALELNKLKQVNIELSSKADEFHTLISKLSRNYKFIISRELS